MRDAPPDAYNTNDMLQNLNTTVLSIIEEAVVSSNISASMTSTEPPLPESLQFTARKKMTAILYSILMAIALLGNGVLKLWLNFKYFKFYFLKIMILK